ncbi:MAG: DUF309 domain-containing protein [Nitrosopumilaceae archaeon]
MIHLKNSKYVPQDANKLLLQARKLGSAMDSTIRDTRVSSRYVEFDVSIKKEDLVLLIKKLEPIGLLDHAKHVVDEEIGKEDAIEKGRYYFNNERFWECHEIFEGVWKKADGKEKDLLQGLILVAAALVHCQKDENEICLSIFRRALEKIGNTTGKYHQIDIDAVRKKVSGMIRSKAIETFTI